MARHAWLCPARYRVVPRRVMTHLNNVVFNSLYVLPFSYRKTKRNFCRRSPRPQNWRPEDFIIKDWQNSKWLWSNMQKDNYQMLTKFILACRIVCWKCVIFRYQAHKPRFLLLLDQYKQHSISLSKNKSTKIVCSSNSYLIRFLHSLYKLLAISTSRSGNALTYSWTGNGNLETILNDGSFLIIFLNSFLHKNVKL